MVVNGEEGYEVETILKHEGKGTRRLYLMRWKGYPITEASWEPESHIQNVPQILEDYLHHVRAEDQHRCRMEGTRRRCDGASEEHKAIGAFAAEGPMFLEGLNARGNCVQCTKPVWMLLQVVHLGRNHYDNSCLGWCGSNSLPISGFEF